MDQTQNGKTGSIGGDGAARSMAHGAEARERLMNELKSVIGDVEHWLRDAQDDAAGGIDHARAQFQETLRTAKTDLLKLEDSMIARTRIAAQQTHVYVQENPWKAVGLGAAVGIIAGLLIARK